jgi:glyoxylase-like metal-dependent hydrolase (beta-lactamase superfamily II)
MIKIKEFIFNPIQVNTYVLYAENNECIIVDPGCYTDAEYLKLYGFIEENNLKPVEIVITHFHFDHVMGCAQVSKKYNLTVSGHADYKLLFKHMDVKMQAQLFDFDFEMPPLPERELKHDDEIILGNNVIKVIHVPGHSPCGIALYVKEDKLLLTGDILFEGSIGRTDLYLGDMSLLVTGIQKKLLCLDDDTKVYSGHGYTTTIGKEKRTNPFF